MVYYDDPPPEADGATLAQFRSLLRGIEPVFSVPAFRQAGSPETDGFKNVKLRFAFYSLA